MAPYVYGRLNSFGGTKTMKYIVTMQRTITQLATIEIVAANEREAAGKADDMRESVEWSTTDTDYDFPDVEAA
jgi:hypothetical protein